MEAINAIKTRRSRREFTGKIVSKEAIEKTNNQPWRFVEALTYKWI
jgi:nitroreductase